VTKRHIAPLVAGLLGVWTLAPCAARAASATPNCRGSDVAGAIIDVQGAAGSAFGRLILVNTSSRTCRARGFIRGQFVGTDGRAMATHVTRDGSDPVRTIRIKPGAAAAATIRWSDIPSGSATSCPTARWLRVRLRGNASSARVYFGAAPCRGDLEVRALTNPARVS
jgi:hypothetical protein